jgi:hypothetical protein
MTWHVVCPNPACPNHRVPRPVDPHLAGKRTRCNQCGTVFVIGSPRPPSSLPEANSPGPASPEGSWARVAIIGGAIGVSLLVLVVLCLVLMLGEESPRSAGSDRQPVVARKDPVEKPPARAEQTTDPVQGKDGGLQKTGKRTESSQEKLIPFDALGAVEKLDKIKVVQVTGRASFTNSTLITDVEFAWHGLTHFRATEKSRGNDFKLVLQGDSGFARGKPIPREQLVLIKNEAYSYSLSNLTPLKNGEFQLKQLDDASVEGRPCTVVEAALPGRPTIKLYFAKDTRLLVKSEFTSVRGRQMLFANHYGDYQETDGVKHWRKLDQYRDGRKYAHIDVLSVRFLETFDKTLFEP